jgi:hypothetical protein
VKDTIQIKMKLRKPLGILVYFGDCYMRRIFIAGLTLFKPVMQENINFILNNFSIWVPDKFEERLKHHLNYVRLIEQRCGESLII